jgi:hypothetical protein
LRKKERSMSEAPRATGHINEEGHLVVEAPAGEKFVFWAGSCGDAECECRDIILYPDEEQSTEDEYLEAVEELRLDPDSAIIRDEEGEELDPTKAPFLRALDDALTGDLLEALVRRWHEEKGVPLEAGKPRKEMLGAEDWKIDEPVAWEQMIEPLRGDDYATDDALYGAMELYNLNPADDSNEVMIEFFEVSEEEDEEEDDIPIGAVVVKLGGGVRFEPEEGEAKVLQELWKMYDRRHPNRERLHERARLMRRLGAELLRKR